MTLSVAAASRNGSALAVALGRLPTPRTFVGPKGRRVHGKRKLFFDFESSAVAIALVIPVKFLLQRSDDDLVVKTRSL